VRYASSNLRSVALPVEPTVAPTTRGDRYDSESVAGSMGRVGRTFVLGVDPRGNDLDDRGYPSKDPDETPIGVKNPADLPTVRNRPHGSGS
jgi:hypothetical protein